MTHIFHSPDSDRPLHRLVDLLRQRVYGLACGYEDLNDHDILRNAIAFETAVEKITCWAAGQCGAGSSNQRIGHGCGGFMKTC
ncbi:MAG: transposase [Methylobacter sp.]|nr:transposase [Methylobacter sp.]